MWRGNCVHIISAKRSRGHSLVDFPQHEGQFWGEKARVAILSIDALGLLSFHWVEYTLQSSLFQSLLGDVCVKAVLPWLYQLPMSLLSPRCKRRMSYAKSEFSSKENTFVVAFKPLNSLHQQIVLRVWGSPCVYVLLTGKDLVGNRQGWLSWVQRNWGSCTFKGLVSLLKQEASIFLVSELVNLQFLPWLYELAMCCLYLIFKRRISHESSEFSKKGDHIWSAFWGMANLCNVPGLREQEAAHWNCSHSSHSSPGEFYWGIGKGYFLEPRHIGAGVCSLSWISSATLRLPNSCCDV